MNGYIFTVIKTSQDYLIVLKKY